LQELVVSGVVDRSQGKGTFVRAGYQDIQSPKTLRVGLILRTDASLSSYFHSQVFEGIRQSAHTLCIDLILRSSSDDARHECDGFLFLSPSSEQIGNFLANNNHRPAVMVGATSPSPEIASIDVDNRDVPRRPLKHLYDLGHTAIGYVGGYDNLCVGRDRWEGFSRACHELNLMPREQHVIRSMSWKLDEREHHALIRVLSAADRPTAIFATGLEQAVNVYHAAAAAGLQVPRDLSVIGVDDPGGAAHLNPPLTTVRQPLMQMGQAAAAALFDLIQHNNVKLVERTLPTEFIIRKSTAVAAKL
jgi:DNA-binding LacI/PurR family transcriptional regulator